MLGAWLLSLVAFVVVLVVAARCGCGYLPVPHAHCAVLVAALWWQRWACQ